MQNRMPILIIVSGRPLRSSYLWLENTTETKVFPRNRHFSNLILMLIIITRSYIWPSG